MSLSFTNRKILATVDQPYHNPEELRLIKQAQFDPRHFAPLYDAHYKPLFRFVYNRIKNREVTADLVQQVFLKAMLNIHKFEFRGHPFSSWLFRIAINEVNMLFRKAKVIEVEVRDKDAVELMNEMGQSENETQIRVCLHLIEKLPQEQSQLIEMRFFDKLSFQEIGEVLNITETNAKMRLYRILEKLKADLLNLLDR